MKKKKTYGYNVSGGTLFAAKEAYRTIRTNLMFSLAKEDCKTIMFTSAIQGEGKTTTSVNIAFSLAKSNKKVLIMDMDLRSPRVHRILKKSNTPGLTNYLSGFATLEEILHKNVFENLDVIFAGTISPNPAEMVASDGVARLLEEMKKHYDYIILDTTPVNIVSDALSLVPVSDGVVMVIRPKYIARKEIQNAIHQLEFVGAKILGAVANGVQEEKHSYGRGYGRYRYRYRYKYGYGYGYGYGAPESSLEEIKKDSKE